MDLISDDVVGTFGLLAAEAVEQLVDRHGDHLDKRAAMLQVDSPSLQEEKKGLSFLFKISGIRQKTLETAIEFQGESVNGRSNLLELELACDARCGCPQFRREGLCTHTLASAWWLQEQLGRRSIDEMVDFFSELQVDVLAEGRQLVDELLTFGRRVAEAGRPDETTRLQWRLSIAPSQFYSPITVRPFEQRPRKNGKGWTKGREIRIYDLLRRDFREHPIDGEIAPLVASPSYGFDDEHFNEFRALTLMIGHPNVAWDDEEATPAEVIGGELRLRLVPNQAESPGEADAVHEPDELGPEVSPADHRKAARYRPQLSVSGSRIPVEKCTLMVGSASPVEHLAVVFEPRGTRLIVCPLRDSQTASLIRQLHRRGLGDILLDGETAERLALEGGLIDRLLTVELPDELAGPVEAIEPELVVELRPRVGAGLDISLAVYDERFRTLPRPAEPPEVVRCLTPEGPVRLRRELAAERERARAVAERFRLDRLTQVGDGRWLAETDAVALEFLSGLYDAGEDAPRMIWPDGETLKVRGEITPASLRVQIDDRKDWFGLQGIVEVDGREVRLSELLEAVRENRTLVRIGDREFAKISEEFRKRLQQLGDTVVQERGSLRVADATAPAVQELLGEDIALEAAGRWHQSLARIQSLADWKPDKPEQLRADLRDYQLDGYRWLARLSRWGVGGVLADDMGLGKTVQALGILVDRAADGPALVVAPTSVGDNWVRETEKFAPDLRPHLYRDSDREKLVRKAAAGDLVIVSYQLLQRDAQTFASRTWNTLVLDEAQFVKNAQTKTSQAIRSVDADWRLGLSGTPLENHLGELWSLFRTLSPGMLGSWERFRKRFAEPIERHHDNERRGSLARLVRPFILRRTKDKVLRELPSRTEITLRAELTGEERRRYEDARLAAVAELSGVNDGQHEGDRRIRTLAWLTRLRQLACHPALVDTRWKKSSAKLDLLLSLIEELREEGHRALIFSQFVKHLTVVRKQLDKLGIPFQYLDGSTPSAERQRRVDAFQGGEGDLFLISLKAGGTGLNLTAADYVIHLDPWWNPAVEDQATDRAHRIGQERPVTVYRLVAEGTIEEQIIKMHADKRALVAGVLDGTDRAAKMDTDELIRLIKEGSVT